MFLLIQQNQVTLRTDELTLKLMQQLVGDPTESAYSTCVEYVSGQFNDTAIDLVCDEEFLFKDGMTPCCSADTRTLSGNVLAVAVNSEGETVGLTPEQVSLVLDNLMVVREIRGRRSADGVASLRYVPARSVYKAHAIA